MLRPPTPDDLYRFRIPTDPHLSPDGALAAMTVQVVAPARDGYRHAVWLVPTDGSSPARQVTLGARHDTRPRFSPDGTALAFLSDRRPLVEDEPAAPKDREDGTQVHLLPLSGGEARRLTDLPRGVDAFEWSPDGRSLVVRTTSFRATHEEDRKARGKPKPPQPGDTPHSDYRYFDRLQNMLNGPGFIDDKVAHLWLVDVETGAARRLTDGPTSDDDAAWSPDGTRIAFAASRGRDHDLDWQFDVFVVEVTTGAVTRVTDGSGCVFVAPAWLPDGRTLAVLGHRFPRGGGSRNDVWLFAADGSDARPGGGTNLSGRHDLMVGSGMGSDVVPSEATRLRVTPDGSHILVTAPVRGSYELWRIAVADGALERLTDDRHYLSGWEAEAGPDGGLRVAAIRSTATALSDLHVLDLAADGSLPAGAALRRVTAFNDDVLGELDVRELEERWETVDGREVQGWLIRSAAAAAGAAGPLVLQIHGGPHTLYGWAPYWEFQVLAGAGMSVLFTNPRGSEGYGEDFNSANLPDWGSGPMADVMAHVEALVASGVADPARLGVTGGSYGGYLTNWIVGHSDRFAAALTCRSVSDLTSLMLTGDLAGGIFGIMEFGAQPWENPQLYRELSPITYADRIRTPLLIQHAENDLRCPIGQAEALFAILRTMKRPVRFMRVPNETHELTRSGTPFRRVENLVQVRSWFDHFLVRGKRRLPPLPANRAGI
jgi:dipeptidyl aminopeptidase/acylaminoacyl peptidase